MERRPAERGNGVGVTRADLAAIGEAARRMTARGDLCADCKRQKAVILRRTRAKWSGVCRACSGTTGTRRPAVRAGAPGRGMDASVAASWRRLGRVIGRF